MVKTKTESQTGGNVSGAYDSAESKPKKEERMALSAGVLYPVERSFYDPKQNCVIDVLRVEKTVQNRKGEHVDITIFRKEYCKDESIQAKYKRTGTETLEVTDV